MNPSIPDSESLLLPLDDRQPQDALWLIAQVHGAVSRRLQTCLKPLQLNPVHWAVLNHLQDRPDLGAGELSRLIDHDSGAMSRLLEQLQQRGLVQRLRCKLDRRRTLLRLTTQGQQLLARLTPQIVAQLNGLLGGFSGADATCLIKLLDRFIGPAR